jgi:hypothetical protein
MTEAKISRLRFLKRVAVPLAISVLLLTVLALPNRPRELAFRSITLPPSVSLPIVKSTWGQRIELFKNQFDRELYQALLVSADTLIPYDDSSQLVKYLLKTLKPVGFKKVSS